MPTQTKSDPLTETIEGTSAKATELGQGAFENGKKTSLILLDSYEKAVGAFADTYVKAAESIHIEWVSTFAAALADVAREVARSYAGAARTFVA